MTKTEKKARARKIRAHLARFVDLQSSHMREHVKREWGRDPDEAAMTRLLLAQQELQLLIRELDPKGALK